MLVRFRNDGRRGNRTDELTGDVPMHGIVPDSWLEQGLAAADWTLHVQDRIWSRNSHDKVDIGMRVSRLLRPLYGRMAPGEPLRTLSIGCGYEPQFRLLQGASDGGLYLLDIDP
jgi:hypothetical protein